MKATLFLDAGGKLLGTSPFLVAKASSTVVLSKEVCQCLSMWLSECAEHHLYDIDKFCVEYLMTVGSRILRPAGIATTKL